MPFFSIVIPGYNCSAYLGRSLGSLLAQDFEDWEAIVVLDGCEDDSAAVARRIVDGDERVRIVEKSANEGTHIARCEGVALAEGRYLMFLDADDEYLPGSLAKLHGALESGPCDILHFGMEVAPHNGVSAEEAGTFEAFANKPFDDLVQPEIMETVFSEECGYQRDWRVWQRAFRAEVAKEAFARMSRSRLDRGEDGYEYFVIAGFAHTERTDNAILVYRYHYGLGSTGASALGLDAFISGAQSYARSNDAALLYAKAQGDEAYLSYAEGFARKHFEILANEWRVRVADEDKVPAAHQLAQVIGFNEVARELYRHVRDEAYKVWVDESIERDERVREWFECAGDLKSDCRPGFDRCEAMGKIASSHIADIRNRVRFQCFASSPIRIFVTTHKEVDYFDSQILQPVQVGAGGSASRFPDTFHDDEGENISGLNPLYCELTTQYWAWKNIAADYYGFCHYRRYFNFSDASFEENAYGEVVEDRVDREAQLAYGLTDEAIRDALDGYDLVVTEIKQLSSFPEGFASPREQYAAAPHLHVEDLDRVFAIAGEMYPDYQEDLDAFINGGASCFCNMFVMTNELFQKYSPWLFSILDRFMDEWDYSRCDKEGLRTPGHLSERLLNVFIAHERRVNPDLRMREVQCVRFEAPERLEPQRSLAANVRREKPVIPVVFAADDNYVPMLTTTIYSMLKNASTDFFYDVCVLQNGITGRNQEIMRDFFLQFGNAALRFLDVGGFISRYDLSTNNEHIGIETYFRFIIQDALPFYDKVLYLDSDLIVTGDVSQLYAEDVSGFALAAVRDVDYLGNLNMKNGDRLEYTKSVLGMTEPYDYFQAGVLLLNTAVMRSLHGVEEWLELASNPVFIYNDQDILNAECQGRVRYLDFAWNVMNDCGGRIAKVFSFAPAEVYDSYLSSRWNPKIVHYAGCEKPWSPGGCDEDVLYWSYARETPFYEKLLLRGRPVVNPPVYDMRPPRAISEGNPLRAVVDPLMPLGSRRREVAKAIGRGMRGRA